MDHVNGQLFLRGACYYRQIRDLGISLCAAKVITDADWSEYLQGGLRITRAAGQPPKLSLATFLHAIPNAGQRKMLASHMADHGLPQLDRAAILTDSALMRGALTAFGWLAPHTKMRTFRLEDSAGAIAWLAEARLFDATTATAAWAEARMKVGATV